MFSGVIALNWRMTSATLAVSRSPNCGGASAAPTMNASRKATLSPGSDDVVPARGAL
jgi:hypothetical protein